MSWTGRRLGAFFSIHIAIITAAITMGWAGDASAALPDPVKTDLGLVSGTGGTSNAAVRVFKGIPFAAPPTGPNRWRAPQPAAAWEGVRQGDAFGNRCIAGGGGGARGAAPGRGGRGAAPAPPPGARGDAPARGNAAARGNAPAAPPGPPQPPASEDCLYLNIWSSAATASDRRPVMVWMYGGGFTGGSGSEARYDGERLAAKGVVVVTFNYRLGLFGFFAHPELTKESGRNASGNYAVMDAIAALQWVTRNVAAFGGDPANVTIFGESAGAMMTSALTGVPQAKGLFRRTIAQSSGWMGLLMAPMVTRAAHEQAGAKAAADAGMPTLADLRAKSTEDVGAVRISATIIVDGYVVPEDLSKTFSEGRQHDVDILVGSNKDEGTFFPGGPAATAAGFRTRAQERFGELAGGYLALYPSATDADASTSYLTSYSDEMSWNMRQWAALQSKRGKKAFVYYFTRVPRTADGRPSPRGATHTAEIAYAFNNPTGQQWDDTDRRLADVMSSYWVNFATKGDPNGPGLPTWPVYQDMNSGRVVLLGDTIEAESAAPTSKLTFYDSAYARLLKTR